MRNPRREWTEAEDAYLIKTNGKKSIAEQAMALGRTRGAVAAHRSALIRADRLRCLHRRDPLSEIEIDRAIELIRDGATWADVARQLNRPARTIWECLATRRGATLGTIRREFMLTLQEVCDLFSVSREILRGWITHGWISCSRSGHMRVLYSSDDILTFMRRRSSWPVWSVEAITDPDWRDEARRIRHNDVRWLSTAEVAHALGYSLGHIKGMVSQGQIESLKCGGVRYIPAPEVERLLQQREKQRRAA